MPQHNPKCFANHMGLWAIEPHWFNEAVTAILAGTWKPIEVSEEEQQILLQMGPEMTAGGHEDDDGKIFQITSDGVGIVQLKGPMMKGFSKFGGTSSVFARQQIRAAVSDSEVRAILLHIDSPGGHVAGTQELADDVRAANNQKPVFAQIEDMGASAAFWVASQAGRISANATAQVGSIGMIAIVDDTSKANEMAGVKTHVISTGAFKAAFASGAPVTKSHLAEFQERVEDLNGHFLDAVGRGRGLSGDRLDAVSDGRIFTAGKALDLGLIDSVQSTDATLMEISQHLSDGEAAASAKHTREATEARLRLEKARG